MSHVGRVSARHLRVARRVGARTHHLTAARRAEARPTICRRVCALHAPFGGGGGGAWEPRTLRVKPLLQVYIW